jgi:uncharacterized glyoxalase superfamily protein PhnB
MKPTPKNWTRISPCVNYQDANQAIDWLCEAFGFEVRLKVEGEGGILVHSELTFGDGLLMVADERSMRAKGGVEHHKSPKSLGGAVTGSYMVYVDDVVAHCERARKAGATIVTEPKVTDYGEEYWSDRAYEARDPEGHTWYFAERLRSSDGPAPKLVKH